MITHKEIFFNYIHPIIYRLVLVLSYVSFLFLRALLKEVIKIFSFLTDQRFPPKPPSAPIEIIFRHQINLHSNR